MALDDVVQEQCRNMDPAYMIAPAAETPDVPKVMVPRDGLYGKVMQYLSAAEAPVKQYTEKAMNFILPDGNWALEDLPDGLWGYCVKMSGRIGINEKLVGWAKDLFHTSNHEVVHRHDFKKIGNNLIEYVTDTIATLIDEGKNSSPRPDYSILRPRYA